MIKNFRFFKTVAYATLFLILFSISCRKADVINPEITQDSKQLKEKFFTLPATIDPEIKKVADNLQKQQRFINDLPGFIKKNGIPKWDKTIFKVAKPAVDQSKFRGKNARTSSSDSSTQGLFLIPLQSTSTNNIQSYITCYKHSDSVYTYRLYNKDSLDNVHPANDTSKARLVNAEAVLVTLKKV